MAEVLRQGSVQFLEDLAVTARCADVSSKRAPTMAFGRARLDGNACSRRRRERRERCESSISGGKVCAARSSRVRSFQETMLLSAIAYGDRARRQGRGRDMAGDSGRAPSRAQLLLGLSLSRVHVAADDVVACRDRADQMVVTCQAEGNRRRMSAGSSLREEDDDEDDDGDGGGEYMGKMRVMGSDEEERHEEMEVYDGVGSTWGIKKMHDYEEDEDDTRTRKLREMSRTALKFPEEDVKKAKHLIANLIKSGDEIEENIVEAADNGLLNEIVLYVIKRRLELARLDSEMLSRMASPALQFLNELMHMKEGESHAQWQRDVKKRMQETFCPENLRGLMAMGITMSEDGRVEIPEDDNSILRFDFLQEIDNLLAETAGAVDPVALGELGMDGRSVAFRLQQEERLRIINQVKELRRLAIELKL
ncbi:hypothetical protein CBR_g23747 [Chara braunii]|uniref:Uncharacterized protein n=1 Tax=Chara braunii TaxID=69332 RepID=A0A388JVH0_CHABU|nr:hypothetical protein CBR_g23747 [Chara braunii]|eukprot:GBG61788.1 hypothetical protein CBR_g23747 [Chara braunii]